MATAEVLQGLIDEASEWLTSMPDQLAELLLSGQDSPFVAQMTPSDKMAYYMSKFYNPDGSPNQLGRQGELTRLGVPDYMKALATVQKLKGMYYPSPVEGEL